MASTGHPPTQTHVDTEGGKNAVTQGESFSHVQLKSNKKITKNLKPQKK
jgi:hypothetical protein